MGVPEGVTQATLEAALGGPVPDAPTDPRDGRGRPRPGRRPGAHRLRRTALLRLRHRRRPAGQPGRRLADLGLGPERRAVRRLAGRRRWSRRSPGAGRSSCSACHRRRRVGFTTGATMANFTAVAAARHALLRSAGWNVEEDGLIGAPPLTRHRRRARPRLDGAGPAAGRPRPRARPTDPCRRARDGWTPRLSARHWPALDRPGPRVRPGGRRQQRRVRSAGGDRRRRARAAGDVAARRRRIRPVGGRQPDASPPPGGPRPGRLVGHRRPQVAQRAVRLWSGLRA